MINKNLSRRSFLKSVAIASAGTALAGTLPGATLSAQPKSNESVLGPKTQYKPVTSRGKVRLACIGIGNRGNAVVNSLYNTGLCDIVALCDVDMGAPHTKEIMDKFPKAKRFQDFRDLFEKYNKEFDAVSICVPDHSHFPITMTAMSYGKHVYVEKPLARTFLECELLMAAEKKYGVVTQMGNQGHSGENYYQFKAWTEAGIIKNVTKINAHMNNGRRWHKWDVNMKSYPAAEPIPSTLNWDTWLGVCSEQDYNHDFVNGQWRCWYDFGMGALGDWGAHILDTAHRFLKLGLPTEINPTFLEGHNPFFFPMSSTILFKFPAREGMPPVDVTWYDGIGNYPELPEGYGKQIVDKNIPLVAGQKFVAAKLAPGKEIYSEDVIFKGGTHSSPLQMIPGKKAKELESKLPKYEKNMPDHAANFLLACQGKTQPNSPFSITGPLSQVFCLGVLAQRFGTKLIFDPVKKRITNNPLANQMLRGGVPRQGWEDLYKL